MPRTGHPPTALGESATSRDSRSRGPTPTHAPRSLNPLPLLLCPPMGTQRAGTSRQRAPQPPPQAGSYRHIRVLRGGKGEAGLLTYLRGYAPSHRKWRCWEAGPSETLRGWARAAPAHDRAPPPRFRCSSSGSGGSSRRCPAPSSARRGPASRRPSHSRRALPSPAAGADDGRPDAERGGAALLLRPLLLLRHGEHQEGGVQRARARALPRRAAARRRGHAGTDRPLPTARAPSGRGVPLGSCAAAAKLRPPRGSDEGGRGLAAE